MRVLSALARADEVRLRDHRREPFACGISTVKCLFAGGVGDFLPAGLEAFGIVRSKAFVGATPGFSRFAVFPFYLQRITFFPLGYGCLRWI